MGLITGFKPISSQRISTSVPLITPQARTFLEQALRPLDILDSPGNVVRSILTGEITNALREITPFVKARRITPQEVTQSLFGVKTDTFIGNLAIELVLDPLTYVAGLGVATKAAKATKLLRGTTKNLAAAEKFLAEATGIERKLLRGEIKGFKKEIKKLFKDDPEVITRARDLDKSLERSLVRLGFGKASFDVGDFNKIKAAVGRVPPAFLPSAYRINVQRKLARTEFRVGLRERQISNLAGKKLDARSLKKNVQARDSLTKVRLEQARLTQKLAEFRKPLVQTPIALENFIIGATRLGQGIKAKFKLKSDNTLTEALRTRRDISTRVGERPIKNAEQIAINKLEQLQNTSKLSQKELNERLLEMAEVRHLIDKGIDGRYTIKAPEEAAEILLETERLQKIVSAELVGVEIGSSKYRQVIEEFGRNIEDFRFKINERTIRLTGISDKIKEITTEEIDFVNLLFHNNSTMLRMEQAQRLPVTALKSDFDYVKRLITPEAKKFKRIESGKYGIMLNEAKVIFGSASKRHLFPELSIVGVNQKLKNDFGIKFDFFDTDVVQTMFMRRIESNKVINRAKFVNIIIGTHAKEGILGTPVKDFLKTMGMTGDAIGDLSEISKTLKIPTSIVDDVKLIDKTLKDSIFNDEGLDKMFKFIDSFARPFRTALTVPFPAFHSRNMISNMFLNAIGGVNPITNIPLYARMGKLDFKAFTGKKLSTIKDIKLGRGRKVSEVELMDLMRDQGVFNRGFFSDQVVEGANIGTPTLSFRHPFKTVAEQGRRIGTGVENNARMTHFVAKMRQGSSAVDAVKSVNKFLFDYGALTQFEKSRLRPAFLFYTWTRKNLPLMINTVISNPRIAATYRTITEINQQETPDWLRATSAFPVGKGLFVGSLGIPLEDLNILNVSDTDPKFFMQLARVVDKIASQMAPPIRMAYELARGQTAYSQRPLDEVGLGRLFLENTPLARASKTAGMILDPKETIGSAAVRFMFGPTVYKVNPVRAQLDELNRIMVGTGKFKRSGFIVFKKRDVDKNDPQVIKLLKQKAILEKLRRAQQSKVR